MKKSIAKKLSGVIFVLLTAGILFSCKTMQEDVLVTSEDNNLTTQAISDIEEAFISLDAKCYLSKSADSGEINNLISEIELQTNEYLKEPSLVARLSAFRGLLEQLIGKQKKAQESLELGKKNQANDVYVVLLETRLLKTTEDKIARLDEILNSDPDNGILLLEKGKLLFESGKYKDCVAYIDNAFISLDRADKSIYRQVYTSLRNSAWDIYSLNIEDTGITPNKNIPLTKVVTLDDVLVLTQEQTTLLEAFTGGQEMTVKDLKSRLSKSNYFSAARDPDDQLKTSLEMIQSSSMSRILCARFLWTLFIQKNSNASQLTKYSDRYAKRANAKSPIPDIALDSLDFDAALGTVENEIIDLPDGINFKPDEQVTAMEYIKWLQNTAK